MTISTRFQGCAAIITLNRPEHYNAINLEMVQQIAKFLDDCKTNSNVEKIIITSDHPKVFCAGGDIKAAYVAMKGNDQNLGAIFLEAEYKLIYDLATYSKPIIPLVNGICFGGGMGLFMHNHIRVVTENAVLGMPETIIGFFPDVASSLSFSRFPKAWANFYALTGSHISNSHALKWGMADYFVSSKSLKELIEALCVYDSDDVIKNFSQSSHDESGKEWVEEVFSKGLMDIFKYLKSHEHPETIKTLSDLNQRSPLSLLVTNKLLEISEFLDLKKALQLDFVIANNFLSDSDFMEGIRAQVIDKDRQPKWKYNFSNITEDMVRCYFIPRYSDI